MDFEDFYGRYVDRVAWYVLRHTRLRDAEEFVAETFTVAWDGLSGIDAARVPGITPGALRHEGEVNVIAHVPGLRGRIVEVVGASIPLMTAPLLGVLKT